MTEGTRATRGFDAFRRVAGLAVLLVLPVLALEAFLMVYADPGLEAATGAFWRSTTGKVVAGVLVLLVLAAGLDHLRLLGRAADRAEAAFRAGGVALAVLLLVHVLSVDWFASRTEDAFFAMTNRLSNPLWRFLDWLTFVVAAVHSGALLTTLVSARVAAPRWRAATAMAAIGLVVLVGAFATFAYFTLPLYPRNPLHGGP